MIKKNKGFTLIETIMAIVLLGIIAVTIGLFVSQQLQAVARTQEYTSALDLGRFEMERVANLAFTAIPAGATTTANYQTYPYDLVRTVSYVFGSDATPESLKQVTVEVRKSGSSENLVKIITYIARNLTFGQ